MNYVSWTGTIEPGNGSKYTIGLFQDDGDCVVCWFRSGSAGPSMLWRPGDVFSMQYICTKMDIDIADAVAIYEHAEKNLPICVSDLDQWTAVVRDSHAGTA